MEEDLVATGQGSSIGNLKMEEDLVATEQGSSIGKDMRKEISLHSSLPVPSTGKLEWKQDPMRIRNEWELRIRRSTAKFIERPLRAPQGSMKRVNAAVQKKQDKEELKDTRKEISLHSSLPVPSEGKLEWEQDSKRMRNEWDLRISSSTAKFIERPLRAPQGSMQRVHAAVQKQQDEELFRKMIKETPQSLLHVPSGKLKKEEDILNVKKDMELTSSTSEFIQSALVATETRQQMEKLKDMMKKMAIQSSLQAPFLGNLNTEHDVMEIRWELEEMKGRIKEISMQRPMCALFSGDLEILNDIKEMEEGLEEMEGMSETEEETDHRD